MRFQMESQAQLSDLFVVRLLRIVALSPHEARRWARDTRRQRRTRAGLNDPVCDNKLVYPPISFISRLPVVASVT